MRRREFIALLGGAAAWSLPRGILAENVAHRRLVAVLIGSSASIASRWVRGLSQGLEELGYGEGRSIDIVYRYAEGDVARMPALADELVQLKPNVIVTATTPGVFAIKQATATIPIVNASMTDPVGFGFVASEARPGGQVTGILVTLDSLFGKQLELLVEMVPDATTIGTLLNVANQVNAVHRGRAEAAAKAKAIKLVPVEIQLPADINTAFQTFVQERVQAVILSTEVLVLSEGKRIAALAAATRLPTIYSYRETAQDGGLMSYGINLHENFRRAAAFVDRILKGAKPGDLPVEFPTKLELVINLKTAKALGLTVPPSILVRADEVIE